MKPDETFSFKLTSETLSEQREKRGGGTEASEKTETKVWLADLSIQRNTVTLLRLSPFVSGLSN